MIRFRDNQHTTEDAGWPKWLEEALSIHRQAVCAASQERKGAPASDSSDQDSLAAALHALDDEIRTRIELAPRFEKIPLLIEEKPLLPQIDCRVVVSPNSVEVSINSELDDLQRGALWAFCTDGLTEWLQSEVRYPFDRNQQMVILIARNPDGERQASAHSRICFHWQRLLRLPPGFPFHRPSKIGLEGAGAPFILIPTEKQHTLTSV